tara:strand:- start:3232 stop:3549 length:318 start_codon:yes stop_codon:yes gene_type:complete
MPSIGTGDSLSYDVIEGYQLGLLFGLSPKQTMKAIRFYEKVRLDPTWTNKRSDYALLVDCLYMAAKSAKTGITVRKVVEITKRERGRGTQPKLNEWLDDYRGLLS